MFENVLHEAQRWGVRVVNAGGDIVYANPAELRRLGLAHYDQLNIRDFHTQETAIYMKREVLYLLNTACAISELRAVDRAGVAYVEACAIGGGYVQYSTIGIEDILAVLPEP